jgi:hypothetical protein
MSSESSPVCVTFDPSLSAFVAMRPKRATLSSRYRDSAVDGLVTPPLAGNVLTVSVPSGAA